MTVFVALVDVIDNPGARAALERNFTTVVVATAREHAVTELTALGDTVDAAIIGIKERIDAGVLVALPRLRVVGSSGAGTDHLDLVALANRGVADDGTVAIIGDRGLWSPHVAGITVEASAAMDDVVVRGVVQAITSRPPQ